MRLFAAVSAVALLAVPVTAAPEFSADRIKADVSFLADDLLEGRDTGSRGHEIAARYVATQFAAAGLQPGGKQGWFTPILLSEARIGDGATLTIAGKGGGTVLAHGVEALIGPSHDEAKTEVAAPLVFVGWGLDDPKYGYDDYKGLDVRGKIVVMLRGIPKGPPDEVVAHLADQKVAAAARHGAIGVITLPTVQSEKIGSFAKRVAASKGRPSTTWVTAQGKAFDEAPGVRGAASVGMAGAEAIFAGARTPFAKVLAAADAQKGRPSGFPLATSARLAFTSTATRITSPNVVGMIIGSDPVLKHEVVILMGHLDHIGIKPGCTTGDCIRNGALDNAAGTAVVMEAARAFGREAPPKRTMVFIANTAEERGLLGAEATANMPPVPIDTIVAAVDLDMPLLLYPFTDVIAFGGDHSTVGATIAKATAAVGVSVSPDPMPEETVFVRSDHYAFVKQGVPAIMLATGYGNGGEKAWKDFFATHYHQVSDDLNLPIDWQAGAKYARVNYLIARDLADAPERPRWYQGDYFGNAFAPGAPKAAKPGK